MILKYPIAYRTIKSYAIPNATYEVRTMNELRQIPNVSDKYAVDPFGNVFSKYSNKFLRPFKQNKGYLCVDLSDSGVISRYLVHRLVAEAYCHKPEGCNVVNHLDNDPSNNHYTNLEWTTDSGNKQHAGKQGRLGHSVRVLTEPEVIEIWEQFLQPREQTAQKYGVCLGTIRAIYDGLNWKHLYDKFSHHKDTGEKPIGSRQSGATNAIAKLSEENVLDIVQNYKGIPQHKVASIFDVSRATIGYIRSGDTWCTVTYPYITPRKWPRGIPTPEGVDTTGWGFS